MMSASVAPAVFAISFPNPKIRSGHGPHASAFVFYIFYHTRRKNAS